MNSAEHPRRPQQSADGGARRDPDSSESAPDTDDALTDVLRAMRDAVEEHREPSRKRASEGESVMLPARIPRPRAGD
jgi:hypothetical protein